MYIMDFIKKVKTFKEENNLTDDDCARKLGVDIKIIKNLTTEAKTLEKAEKERIIALIDGKQKNKKISKILDLVFRFVAMVMALTVLLLCINENVDTRSLIVLLAIGLVCSSMTILPKIDK